MLTNYDHSFYLRPISCDTILTALTNYLSLNGDIHLLPVNTLQHLIALYAVRNLIRIVKYCITK